MNKQNCIIQIADAQLIMLDVPSSPGNRQKGVYDKGPIEKMNKLWNNQVGQRGWAVKKSKEKLPVIQEEK